MMAQNSFQQLDFDEIWVIIITLWSLDAANQVANNCPIIGEHIVVCLTQ